MIASKMRTSFRAVLAGLSLALLISASAPVGGGDSLAARRDKPHHGVVQERKGKRPKSKTVTRTFTQSNGMTIPDLDDGVPADPYPSTIEVNGLKGGRIVDLDLTLLGFKHEIPLDVDILLVKGGDNPTAVQVIGDVGDVSFDDVAFITLDDEATESLPFFDELLPGRFRPTDHDGDMTWAEAGVIHVVVSGRQERVRHEQAAQRGAGHAARDPWRRGGTWHSIRL